MKKGGGGVAYGEQVTKAAWVVGEDAEQAKIPSHSQLVGIDVDHDTLVDVASNADGVWLMASDKHDGGGLYVVFTLGDQKGGLASMDVDHLVIAHVRMRLGGFNVACVTCVSDQ
jgi:hypothetical protein